MDSYKNKGFQHQEACDNQPHRLSFYDKRILNSNPGKVVGGDTGPPSTQYAGFLNKTPVPCPNNLSLDLYVYPGLGNNGRG